MELPVVAQSQPGRQASTTRVMCRYQPDYALRRQPQSLASKSPMSSGPDGSDHLWQGSALWPKNE